MPTPIIINNTREEPTCMVGNKEVLKVLSEESLEIKVLVRQYNSCLGEYSEYEDNYITVIGFITIIVFTCIFIYVVFRISERILR